MSGIGNEFSIEEHKKKYINYLKVIVYPDGSVCYARPSHTAYLQKLLSERYGIPAEDVAYRCPKEYIGDYNTWLCKETGCACVWNDYANWYSLTDEQLRTLEELRDAGLLKTAKGFQFNKEYQPPKNTELLKLMEMYGYAHKESGSNDR